MKEKLKAIFRNKFFIFCLPILFYLIIFGGEYLFDVIVGDGDGNITVPVFVKLKPFIGLALFLYLLFNVFTILFKMSIGQTIFNFCFIIVVLYSVEYFLKKKDPFLKGAFDSGHYHNNLSKYKNFYDAPADYKEKYITWGHNTKKNKYSFRDDEIIYPKPNGVFRIMVLGDSFTWGAGLAESEMYSNRLDSMLKEHFKTQNIEVVNCALAGSPTVKERDVLRQLKDTVQPDLILVGFCLNDPQPKSEDYSFEKENFQKKWKNALFNIQNVTKLLGLYYLGEAVVSFIYLIQEKWGNIPSFYTALGRVYDKGSKEWKEFERALNDIKQISDSLHCPTPIAGVFTQGRAFNAGEKLNEKEMEQINISRSWLDQAHAAFKNAGFAAINFVPVFEDLAKQNKIKPEELNVNPLDGHPSAKMNKIFAEELFKKIIPEISNKMDSIKQQSTK